MMVHRNDNEKSLETFMKVVSGPLRASFQSSKIHKVSARQILQQFIAYDNTSSHEDHVKEYRYNIAWRNWAMICDLGEKVWLHYQGTFDKMLALLTTGSGSATQLTYAFDQVMVTAPMTTFQLVTGEDGESIMKSQLTENGKSPKHRAENLITGCGEVTINHVICRHFLTLLELNEQQVLEGVGCDFYMLDDNAMICTRHFVSACHLLNSAAMSNEHTDLQNVARYQDHDDVCPLFETSAQTGVTTLTNQLYRHVLQRTLMKLPVSPNDGSTNASRGDTHSGPIIPGFPTEFITQNTAQTKAKGTKANPSSKTNFKDDSEASDSDEEKQPQRKKSKGSKSVVNTTVRSDGAGATREKAGPSGASGPTRLVNRGPFGLN
jgi:hypothetical protein